MQYVNRIVGDQPKVADAGFLQRQKAVTDPGLVHLYAEEVVLRAAGSLLDQRLAVAEANLEHAGCPAPEQVVQVEGVRRVCHPPDRPEFVQRPLLRCGQPPGPPDKAAYGSPVCAGIVTHAAY